MGTQTFLRHWIDPSLPGISGHHSDVLSLAKDLRKLIYREVMAFCGDIATADFGRSLSAQRSADPVPHCC